MRLFKKDKLQIIGFQSYGTPSKLYLRGRALEDEEIDLEQKGFFNLLRNTWKRFETDELKTVGINAKLPDQTVFAGNTDNHGYFLIKKNNINLTHLANSEGWLQCELSFQNTHLKHEILHQNKFPVEMLIPNAEAEFGVISDIDDTILRTGVVSSLKWQVLVNTFFKRATNRSALEGAADFYQMLHLGHSGVNANPIFYVSHSPWNLYRYLKLFLKTNDFPKGPILLRSMASFRARNRANPAIPQKHQEIINIFKTYPKLSFVLIGDSGEHDGAIYQKVAEQFPGRVKAIYLRSVNDPKRVKRVCELFENYTDVPFKMVYKTEEAIAHAKKLNLITSSRINH